MNNVIFGEVFSEPFLNKQRKCATDDYVLQLQWLSPESSEKCSKNSSAIISLFSQIWVSWSPHSRNMLYRCYSNYYYINALSVIISAEGHPGQTSGLSC